MSEPPSSSFETRQIHAGTSPDPTTGARALPIHATTGGHVAAQLRGLHEALAGLHAACPVHPPGAGPVADALGVPLRVLASPYGHDGFLIEVDAVGALVRELLGT